MWNWNPMDQEKNKFGILKERDRNRKPHPLSYDKSKANFKEEFRDLDKYSLPIEEECLGYIRSLRKTSK